MSQEERLAEYNFKSAISNAAQKFYQADFVGDDGEKALDGIWIDFLNCDLEKTYNQTDRKRWIDAKLASLFQCVDARPVWVGDYPTPDWPWSGGRPMMFVRQFAVTQLRLPNGNEAGKHEVYVFSIDEPATIEGVQGWFLKYSIVTRSILDPGEVGEASA